MSGAPRASLARSEWAELGRPEPLPVDADELDRLRGRNEPVGLAEVAEVYRPLSQLVALQVVAGGDRSAATAAFLRRPARRAPSSLAWPAAWQPARAQRHGSCRRCSP